MPWDHLGLEDSEPIGSSNLKLNLVLKFRCWRFHWTGLEVYVESNQMQCTTANFPSQFVFDENTWHLKKLNMTMNSFFCIAHLESHTRTHCNTLCIYMTWWMLLVRSAAWPLGSNQPTHASRRWLIDFHPENLFAEATFVSLPLRQTFPCAYGANERFGKVGKPRTTCFIWLV